MKNESSTIISDEAVETATGKNWKQWFEILDKEGAKVMTHKQIVAILHEYNVDAWWQQMVTVTYEQSRGLRQKYQTASGYQVSASKTFKTSAEFLYNLLTNEAKIKSWLGNFPIELSNVNPHNRV